MCPAGARGGGSRNGGSAGNGRRATGMSRVWWARFAQKWTGVGGGEGRREKVPGCDSLP